MANKQKFYVVWRGIKPGIYFTWEECKAQINKIPNPAYKSFETKEQAIWAFENMKEQYSAPLKIEENSIAVDASCIGNPGLMEYRGVETITKKEIFRVGPYRDGTNNIGEFLALVHALAFFEKQNNLETIIYTDSQTAMSWVKNKKAKSNLKITPNNKIVFDLIIRAENWLKSHDHRNKIIKWPTELWGEIPADFGRK